MLSWLKRFAGMHIVVSALFLMLQFIAWLVMYFVTWTPPQLPGSEYWLVARIFVVIAAAPAFIYACDEA